ncbi:MULTISPECIES: hypothetical protein [unclassified Moorena]|uniref:hypothetical protein n=1 Tax=unclassified Moorena TaxID=2683338 RepID=UPI0013FF400D|nr:MULTISPECIES: hypothetical protein [unclassified Moorena]NEO14720.1 hypothetical protein [Moorena sp. SIO3E8]NEQ01153.1 hypothetical protein [Moorena sp. SIO3F7]
MRHIASAAVGKLSAYALRARYANSYQLSGALTARGQISKRSRNFQPAVLARKLVYYRLLIS